MADPEESREKKDNIGDEERFRKLPEYRAFEKVLRKVIKAPRMPKPDAQQVDRK